MFFPNDRASFREAVRLGFPGPSEEKMGELKFEMEDGMVKDNFPPVPVDYGYRDSTNFWYTRFPRLVKPIAEPIPAPKEVDLESIRYAANRADDTVKFTDEALKNFVKVPRPFLKTVLNGCVEWAKENGVTMIDDEHVKIINDKRAQEKRKTK